MKKTAKNVFNLLLQNEPHCGKGFSGIGSHYITGMAPTFQCRVKD
jgi:hypothetical protein